MKICSLLYPFCSSSKKIYVLYDVMHIYIYIYIYIYILKNELQRMDFCAKNSLRKMNIKASIGLKCGFPQGIGILKIIARGWYIYRMPKKEYKESYILCILPLSFT